jgi:tRNA(Ile)-lysidine synthase
MTTTFDAAIAAFEASLPLAIAYSGGADSTALLVAASSRWPGQVSAIHVNHGLQAAATEFEAHCKGACAALDVPLHTVAVDARNAPGESPEDAARRARYDAIHDAARANRIACVGLAQHADDQVETLLLALSRGAGVAGLAGMRASWERDGIRYMRPLLNVPAAAIRDWLRGQGIAWIEDPTNASERYTRNRIRARVLPALAESFPAFRDTFARSARHAAQAQALIEQFAREDSAETGSPPNIAALQKLSTARRANVLRHWLRASHGTTPQAAQLDELVAQVADCVTRGHRIHLKVGRGVVMRDGPQLRFLERDHL